LHETPPIKIGLNRQPIVDEELALDFTDDSSQMGLTGGGSRTRWT
jgi:hypothetical protein